MGSWGRESDKEEYNDRRSTDCAFLWDEIALYAFYYGPRPLPAALGGGTGRKEGLLRLCCRGRVELSYLIRRLEIRDRMVDLENFTWLWDIYTQLLL